MEETQLRRAFQRSVTGARVVAGSVNGTVYRPSALSICFALFQSVYNVGVSHVLHNVILVSKFALNPIHFIYPQSYVGESFKLTISGPQRSAHTGTRRPSNDTNRSSSGLHNTQHAASREREKARIVFYNDGINKRKRERFGHNYQLPALTDTRNISPNRSNLPISAHNVGPVVSVLRSREISCGRPFVGYGGVVGRI
ncbi:hypothetical protein BaRGS_00014099 [Batillaria attramentaria]|uniref:Uncharacterized protein n=1 Tax=Batillaria attramentaria TaxID=370345 RepID=A0ABD0L5V4_9CAEN